MTEQEKTLCEALSYARIEELPERGSKNGAWTKAIALVTKSSNRQSYVIVKKIDGEVSVIKDFGATCSISSIDTIYPYEGAAEFKEETKKDAVPTTQPKGGKSGSHKGGKSNKGGKGAKDSSEESKEAKTE